MARGAAGCDADAPNSPSPAIFGRCVARIAGRPGRAAGPARRSGPTTCRAPDRRPGTAPDRGPGAPPGCSGAAGRPGPKPPTARTRPGFRPDPRSSRGSAAKTARVRRSPCRPDDTGQPIRRPVDAAVARRPVLQRPDDRFRHPDRQPAQCRDAGLAHHEPVECRVARIADDPEVVEGDPQGPRLALIRPVGSTAIIWPRVSPARMHSNPATSPANTPAFLVRVAPGRNEPKFRSSAWGAVREASGMVAE